ncbi:MAG: aldehyde dehydrogenase family protein [Flavobacteriales bacterium]|jgi:acyl-CoA reductase-like NAD-dependent aldehyde dehydrogenase|nr:aldehyde dehydrogenase family protein [Flavobacteriales bacterium]
MSQRIKVLKTYKIFINGKFPRTESGRYTQLKIDNLPIANVCLSSRKDVRNAVLSARNAFESWSSKSAYNRSQILYRIAEIIEGNKSQFIEELILQGEDSKKAILEIDQSIDRIIYFAGWPDKINPIFGSVNPVASSHFNFTILEPMGVVGIVAPEENSLLGLISSIIPVILSGNTCLAIVSEKLPLCAISLAEVISNSDVPNGVVNIITGSKDELAPHIAQHMDVNALGINIDNKELKNKMFFQASNNLKRVVDVSKYNIEDSNFESPYIVKKFMEAKTTWHPIEKDFTSTNNY